MGKRILAMVCVMALLCVTFSGCGKKTETTQSGQKEVTLNLATAGDTNMLEFFKNQVGPAFTKKYPNITLNVVGTGTGDDGSRNIYTKWKAQRDANKSAWDIDVACVNESVMKDMIDNKVIEKYVSKISNSKYVDTPASKMSLGNNVQGYVVPLFQSQIVLAYNPSTVSQAPKTMKDLESWIKAHPKKFGYNGVVGGMSGVGFVASWLYYKTNDYQGLAKGKYDASKESSWSGIMKELKSLPVTYTQGNAGTLDMLNRGEIDMGPVWVDMLLLWKSDGRMNPNIKMVLPDPGMPGQPMFMVVGAKATNGEAARQFCDFLADPKVQADYVVGKYTWYPGINAEAVFKACSQKSKDLLFSQVTAEEISKKGLSLPLNSYMQDMQRVYAETK